jgi:3'(2'), 5'-bisphosphate nucleotidase
MLSRAFPQDPIVGEESSVAIREESSKDMLDRIVELANDALTADLGLGDDSTWGIGPGQNRTSVELLDAIDRGNYDGGPTGRMSQVSSLGVGNLVKFLP